MSEIKRRPRSIEASPHAAFARMPGRGQRLEGITRTRLYELAARGLIETRRVGGAILVDVGSLRAFIAAQPPARITPRTEGAASDQQQA